jgi:hypothetical protein
MKKPDGPQSIGQRRAVSLGVPAPREQNDRSLKGVTAAVEEYQTTAQPAPRIEDICAADVSTKSVEWLWHRRIPKGKLTML